MGRIPFEPVARTLLTLVWIAFTLSVPEAVFAQASPFETGANNLVTNLTAIATPIAVILVIALGAAALAGRISWGWPISAIIGIGVIFAAQPIVTWVRGLFGA